MAQVIDGQALPEGQPSVELPTEQVVPSEARRNSRTVSFDDVEAAHSPQDNAVRQQFSGHSRRFRSARSIWRYPTTDGQIPRYMKRAFRLKTFGLLALQLGTALSIGVLMAMLQIWQFFEFKNYSAALGEVITYGTGAVNLLCVLLLHFLADRFPANYVCLALTTVVTGFFWGLTHLAPQFSEVVHLQIGLILCITMLGAAVVSYILDSREEKINGTSIVGFSLGFGYILGCVTTVLLFTLVFTATPFQIFGAVGFSLLLLGILLLDVGGLLVACQPDDFMTVVVAMNSTLLVIVSIPFFFLGFCILRLGEVEGERQQQDVPATAIGAAVPHWEAVRL